MEAKLTIRLNREEVLELAKEHLKKRYKIEPDTINWDGQVLVASIPQALKPRNTGRRKKQEAK